MRNLHSGKLFGDPLASNQTYTAGGNRIPASVFVKTIGSRFPNNGIHIQKIVSKQLCDCERL